MKPVTKNYVLWLFAITGIAAAVLEIRKSEPAQLVVQAIVSMIGGQG